MSSKRSGSPPSKRARQGEDDDRGRAFQGLLRCILTLIKDELPVGVQEEEKEEKKEEEEEEEEEGAGGRGPDWEVLVGHRRELARAVLHLLLAVSRPVREVGCGPAFQRLAGILQGTMTALEQDDGEGRGAAEVVSDCLGPVGLLRQQLAEAGSELREGSRLGRSCSALLDGALRGMDSFMQELQDGGTSSIFALDDTARYRQDVAARADDACEHTVDARRNHLKLLRVERLLVALVKILAQLHEFCFGRRVLLIGRRRRLHRISEHSRDRVLLRGGEWSADRSARSQSEFRSDLGQRRADLEDVFTIDIQAIGLIRDPHGGGVRAVIPAKR